MSLFEAILTVAGWAAAYMAPTIVAKLRGHRQVLAIGALNFLAGWTVVGWIAAIVWALTRDVATVPAEGGDEHRNA